MIPPQDDTRLLAGKRLLVLGATGLIGSAAARAALRHGAVVTGLTRNPRRAASAETGISWVEGDLHRLVTPEAWKPVLTGMDMVANASGILQDAPGEDLDTVHHLAMVSLFEACRDAGIPLAHVSAAGVERGATRFARTKKLADDRLQALDFPWTILRPGMVLGPTAYGGSAMARAIACFPFFLPVAFGSSPVQTVSVDDIAEAVVLSLSGKVPARKVYDLVESVPMPFLDLLLAIRRKAGVPGTLVLAIPSWLAAPMFRAGDLVSLLGWRPPMRSTAMAELAAGVTGDPLPWKEATGRDLRTAEETLSGFLPSVQERWFARMWLLKPAVLATLAAFWAVSGLVGLLRLDEAASVLSSRGMPEGLAVAAVVAGSLADLAIGVGIAIRRHAARALAASVAVSLAYVAGAAMLAPDLWADPLGPMVKVFPAIVLSLVGLAVLEDR